MPRYVRLLSSTCLLLALLVGSARAEEFKFLRPGNPELRNFQPTEPIVIRLPDGISSDELNNLYLELNGIDITQMVSLEGQDVIFTPASPQNPGSYALRLVKMGRGGTLVELSRWNFNVAGNADLPADTSVRGTSELTYSYLAARDEGLDDGSDRHNLAGKGRFTASGQSGRWLFGAQGNGFVNTTNEQNPADNNVEVGEYLLSAERLSDTLATELKLGQHRLEADNLLMKNFSRRGASASFGINGDMATVTGFAMNPRRVVGNENFTGISDNEQRAEGVHASLTAIPDRVMLESTLYRGEGRIFGFGSGTPDASTDEANGFQIGLRGVIVPEQLETRLQFARSNYDYDGSGASPNELDRAYRAALTYSPFASGVTADGRVRKWTLEASYQRTGTYFRSMANTALDPDRNAYTLKSALLYGNLLLDSELAWVTDNVNDIAVLPEEGAFNAWFDGSYAPETMLWGQPIFTFNGKLSDESRQRTPAGYVGPGLDRVSSSLGAGLTMSHDKLMWTLNHTWSRLHDDETSTNSYGSHFTDLTFEYQVANWLTLRPSVQYEWLDENADGQSHGWHLSLGTESVLIADKLYNTTNLSSLLNSGETVQGDEFTFDTDFTWQIRQAATNKPGYAMSVYGAYSWIEPDSTTDETEDARLFLRLKLSAPFAF